MPIVAKNVSLDTNVFEQELYGFDSIRFKQLKRLVEEGYAKVFLTEVSRREVVLRMREHTSAAILAISEMMKKKETRRSLGVLRNLAPKFADFFSKHKSKDLSAELEAQFDQFCIDLRIEILPNSLAEGSVDSVLDDYFHQRAPFKEGNKKAEFPDAFSAAIMKKWCDQNRQNMVVLTEDRDWEGVCIGRLSLQKMLADFIATFPDQHVAKQIVVGIMGPKHDEVQEKIADDFTNLGFIANGVVGEVEKVEDVKVDFDNVIILEAKDGRAIAEIRCHINFVAGVTYEVEGTGMWDSEDEVMRFVETQYDSVTAFTEMAVEVILDYNESDPANTLNVDDLLFDPFDVMVDCNELSEW